MAKEDLMKLEDLPHWDRLAERFWAKIDKSGDCWRWTGETVGHTKYGRVTFYRDRKKIHVRAHRVAYLLTHGQIDDNLECCHRCDNPACCRPDHLFTASSHRYVMSQRTT